MPRSPRWGRAALFIGVLVPLFLQPAAIRAESYASGSFWIPGAQLLDGSATGVQLDQDGVVLGADAPSWAGYEPFVIFGTVESLPLALDGPSLIDELRVDSEVPEGAAVLLEARGLFGSQWGLWEPVGALGALAGASSLQSRVTLLGSAEGPSPLVRGVFGRTRPDLGFKAETLAVQFGPPTVTVWATREGLVGGTTANGHVIVEHDRFVALPSDGPPPRTPLSSVTTTAAETDSAAT